MIVLILISHISSATTLSNHTIEDIASKRSATEQFIFAFPLSYKMKVSILAIAHLSLTASATQTRRRRLKKDAYTNGMRNTLLQVRNIEGTVIADGPKGATARMSMDTEESSGPDLFGKASKDPITTAPPVDTGNTLNDVAYDGTSALQMNNNHNEAKSGKSETSKHHDKHFKATDDISMSMSKLGNIQSSIEYDSKTVNADLKMDSKAEKASFSMDSKAAKRSNNISTEDKIQSMPAAKIMKEEAEEFWLEYDAKKENRLSITDAKAQKTFSFSMDSKTGKSESKGDKETLSMPNVSKAKKIDFSMDSNGSDHMVTLSLAEDHVSHLSPVDSKAGKALSMESNPTRLFSKSDKAGHSLSM